MKRVVRRNSGLAAARKSRNAMYRRQLGASGAKSIMSRKEAMDPDEAQELIDVIEDVKNAISDACGELRNAIHGTPYENHTEAYFLGNVEALLSGDPSSLDALVEWINNDLEEGDSEDTEDDMDSDEEMEDDM